MKCRPWCSVEQFVAAWRYDVVFRGGAWSVEKVFGLVGVQYWHAQMFRLNSLPWPDDVGSTTGYLCFVESTWLRSFGLVWFVRGLARVGLTYVGLFGCMGIVSIFDENN